MPGNRSLVQLLACGLLVDLEGTAPVCHQHDSLSGHADRFGAWHRPIRLDFVHMQHPDQVSNLILLSGTATTLEQLTILLLGICIAWASKDGMVLSLKVMAALLFITLKGIGLLKGNPGLVILWVNMGNVLLFLSCFLCIQSLCFADGSLSGIGQGSV